MQLSVFPREAATERLHRASRVGGDFASKPTYEIVLAGDASLREVALEFTLRLERLDLPAKALQFVLALAELLLRAQSLGLARSLGEGGGVSLVYRHLQVVFGPGEFLAERVGALGGELGGGGGVLRLARATTRVVRLGGERTGLLAERGDALAERDAPRRDLGGEKTRERARVVRVVGRAEPGRPGAVGAVDDDRAVGVGGGRGGGARAAAAGLDARGRGRRVRRGAPGDVQVDGDRLTHVVRRLALGARRVRGRARRPVLEPSVRARKVVHVAAVDERLRREGWMVGASSGRAGRASATGISRAASGPTACPRRRGWGDGDPRPAGLQSRGPSATRTTLFSAVASMHTQHCDMTNPTARAHRRRPHPRAVRTVSRQPAEMRFLRRRQQQFCRAAAVANVTHARVSAV